MRKDGKQLIIFISCLILIGLVWFVTIAGFQAGSFRIAPIASKIKQGLDLKGGVYVVYEAQTDATGAELSRIMDDTIGVFDRRVNGLGLTEPFITKEGDKRIRIELPGVSNVQEAIDSVGKTAQLQFKMEDGTVVLTGADVKKAEVQIDSRKSQPVVGLEFSDQGAKAFSDATQKLVATNGIIQIILDNEIISAPRVNAHITDGKAIIEGGFTEKSAKELANLISAGALPVTFQEVESSVVTATLGEKALHNSLLGGGIGILLVLLFMLFVYRLPGFVADIALLVYMLIVAYVYTGFGITLTLPGIAAMILSVGMAVDANVIIFSRIKEELKLGKSIRVSIDQGFKKALSTILDSQITTFIAGAVLYWLGTGPIRGFAITLIIGIVASVITAVFITKYLLKLFINGSGISNKSFFGVKEENIA